MNISVADDGSISYLENGTYKWAYPGQNPSDFPQEVRDVAVATWNADLVDAYQSKNSGTAMSTDLREQIVDSGFGLIEAKALAIKAARFAGRRRPASEEQSWDAKAAAARAFVAGTAAPDQLAMLEAEAPFRGQTTAELADTVMAAASAFMLAMGTLSGVRHEFEAACDAATEISELQAALADLRARLDTI